MKYKNITTENPNEEKIILNTIGSKMDNIILRKTKKYNIADPNNDQRYKPILSFNNNPKLNQSIYL
ncbi:hypothetical protein RG47T_2400 [Mucilaginibacter polytrichastri]|uniref:Uncharacterized protein n=1 Tax=Mucilaginibacter polytrichastri TaxID=1302689 RepID=A0A1Q5ZYX3_9SPHI|nr:hypothetical protein RG47T_2400 [Mucilaginibacter polytrichastri]